MKTVALINAFPLHTGTTMLVLDYADALRDLGFQVHIYQCVSSIREEKYLDSKELIHGIRFPLYWPSFVFDLLVTFPFKIRSLKEDVVIITDPVLLKLAKKLRSPIVIVHDLRELSQYSMNPFSRLFFKFILRYLKYTGDIITVSSSTEKVLREVTKTGKEITVIDRCSRLSLPTSDYVLRRVQSIRSKGKMEVLYVAADRPYKNISLFIEIASRLQEFDGVSFHFTLVSKLSAKTKKLLSTRHLTNFRVLTAVDNMHSVYESSHVLLFPSFIEGFGLPIVEAMSSGIPVIVSNRDPMNQIVDSSGTVCDPYSVDQWVDELKRLTELSYYMTKAKQSIKRAEIYSFGEFEQKLGNFMKRYSSES